MNDLPHGLWEHLHPEERPLARRFADLAGRARNRGEWTLTPFLDPGERSVAELVARSLGAGVRFYGGHPAAERMRGLFVPPEALTWVADDPETFDLGLVDIRWSPAFGAPGHRDLLGAVLGLGFARERIGDIRLGEGRAEIVTTAELVPAIANGLERAGRIGVRARPGDWQDRLPAAPPEREVRTISVASLRLDAVLAGALRLSREKARRLVESGAVRVNHRPERAPDRPLRAGDLLSVRGFGRVEVVERLGANRSGRERLVVARLGVRR
ncbi:MAG: hypothetical protein IMX05_01190 [Hydrogenibacillus schlegelii]|nr:hypothetical protein [Hydrogenibacillus schlegelii]